MANSGLIKFNVPATKTSAEWFKPMMEGLKDGGILRLKELVEKGIVLAFVGVGIINSISGIDRPSTN